MRRRRGPRTKIKSPSTASAPALDHAPSRADVLKTSEQRTKTAAQSWNFRKYRLKSPGRGHAGIDAATRIRT
jgi:hypothetical protein